MTADEPDPDRERPAVLKHGFHSRKYEDEQGVVHRYVLFVPRSVQQQNLPVIMFLNGRGENGEDGLKQISNNFGAQIWSMQDFFPFLAVAPQCRKQGSWSVDSHDTRWALEILDTVIDEFDADQDRVYLTGVSSGGTGVWNIGSAHADRFAAMVPMCGGGGTPTQLRNARMPIWNFYNDKDKETLVEGNRQLRRQLMQLGLSPLMTEFDATGHDCWTMAYEMPALYRWLLEQNLNNRETDRLFEILTPKAVVETWTIAGDGTWNASDDEVIGQAGDMPIRLLSATFSSAFEFHADVWLPPDAVRELEIVRHGVTETESCCSIVIVPSDLGSGGVLVQPDGNALAGFDAAAEHWLRTNAWNDLRVQVQSGRMRVRFNGWSAADVVLHHVSPEQIGYGVALVARPRESEVRWRYLRRRELME